MSHASRLLPLRWRPKAVPGERNAKEAVLDETTEDVLQLPEDDWGQFWEDLVSLREAARITHLSKGQLLLRLQQGLIQGKLLSKVWVVSKSSAVQYVTSHKRKDKPGAEPGTEKARHGGQAILDRYGPAYFQHLSALGGAAMRQKYGADFYQRIGKAGGEALKEKYGPDHFHQLGKKSGESKRKARQKAPGTEENSRGRQAVPLGEAMRQKFGENYFSRIGKAGGEAVKQKYGSQQFSMLGKRGGKSKRKACRADSSPQGQEE